MKREKKKYCLLSHNTRSGRLCDSNFVLFVYLSSLVVYVFFLFAHRIKTELNMTAATLRRRNKLNILNGFTSAPQQKIKRGREMLGRQQCCMRLVYANA